MSFAHCDKQEFAIIMRELHAVYNRDLNPEALNIWYRLVGAKHPAQRIQAAVDEFCATDSKIPKPADILRIIRQQSTGSGHCTDPVIRDNKLTREQRERAQHFIEEAKDCASATTGAGLDENGKFDYQLWIEHLNAVTGTKR
jgi:hypothetical protein